MSLNLTNKVALITGGGSGIGAAIAIKLTEEGAKVAIVGRTREKLQKVSEACEKVGRKPLIIAADITKEYEVISIVNETVGLFGKLDILINNAGIGDIISILDDNAIASYERVMATNLHAPVRLTHYAGKHLVESKGNIVNISSIASMMVMKHTFAYTTSKAALDHFTRSIAFELAPKGVRVNNVNPGPVKTSILDSMTNNNSEEAEKMWEEMKKMTLLNRVGDSEEVADLVAFLVSDKARSITGATFVTDNGAILKGSPQGELKSHNLV